ncbi:MAG: hypothetical protein Q8O93_02005 [bacterium]|nr:hypothetical protein [bacterium]
MAPINKRIIFISGLLLLSLFAFNVSLAAGLIKDSTKDTIELGSDLSAGLGGYETSADIYGLVQTVISAFLSIVGILLLAYLLYAGYKWMTAHGDEEKVTAAKETIYRAIIGLIIIVAAYAISVFVVAKLEQGTLTGGSAAATRGQQKYG